MEIPFAMKESYCACLGSEEGILSAGTLRLPGPSILDLHQLAASAFTVRRIARIWRTIHKLDPRLSV